MLCPNCKDVHLSKVLTKQGVEVDYCDKCRGIWLDKGEIYYFTNTPTYLKFQIEEALKSKKPSSRRCPKTNESMVSLVLFDTLTIEYCLVNDGIWLDEGELEKLPGVNKNNFNLQLDKSTLSQTATATAGRAAESVLGLSNLAIASGCTLIGLYVLLGIVIILCVEFLHLPLNTAFIAGIVIVILQFVFSPWILDLTLNWFFKISWVGPDDLPQHLSSFISKVCSTQKMKFPRMGLIADGAPQAFTYGHHPDNARIVISQGLIDLLNNDETEAVVAHEIGHAKHWDMLIMTLAQLVPLLLYYIYRTLIRMKSSGRDKSAPYRYIIALVSYILYVISEYIVLWFSRIREYFADRFSGQVTNNPSSLASALVKIGYGLAGQKPDDKEDEAKRKDQFKAVGAFGIFDSHTALSLAVAGYSTQKMGGQVNKQILKEVMKWDLWNPWAMYFELQSTHPLIAKRLHALSRQSVALGKEPYINFDLVKPESYWDEFLIDLIAKVLPVICIILSAVLFFPTLSICAIKYFSLIGMTFGMGYLISVLFSYVSEEFPEIKISGLFSKVKVSGIRPVPCTVKGKIIGRGIPGLIWSEDFVLQDESGIIFLDYAQPLGIWNFFFGLLKAKKYINEDVTVTGWYRRAPVPYIELKSLKDSEGRNLYCYVYATKVIFAVILIVVGLFLSLTR